MNGTVHTNTSSAPAGAVSETRLAHEVAQPDPQVALPDQAPRIVTHYDPKPIPIRGFDWSAIDSSTYDGPGCPVGYGATEAQAIASLREQLEDAAEGRS